MAFIGVRISWLMFARNIDFISVASSAFCLAPTSSSACSSSWRACSCVWPSNSCVRRLRCRMSRLIATTGSSSSSSACSCALNGRNDATSSTPSSASLDIAGSAMAWTRRGLAQTGGDAEVVRRAGSSSAIGLALARALADQPLTEPDRMRGPDGLGETVRGHPLQAPGVSSNTIETGDAAAEHRHQARKQPLPELRQ